MLYQPDAPGDWGQMLETDAIKTSTDKLKTSDGCDIFERSWITDSSDMRWIIEGLDDQEECGDISTITVPT